MDRPSAMSCCTAGACRPNGMRRRSSAAQGARLQPRGRPLDPRHEQPGRVQQPRPPASATWSRRSGSRPSSCASSPMPGARSRAPNWRERLLELVRLRRRPGVLHARRRRRQRARGQVRAAGGRQAAGRDHHARSFLSWRDATGAWRSPATARTQRQVDAEAMGVSHVPPPYAYRCPFGSATTTRVRRTRRRGGGGAHRPVAAPARSRR